MSEKKLLVVLEVTVSDLSSKERKECAEYAECKASELPRLRDLDAFEIAEVLLPVENDTEAFAGSDIYAKFTDSKIIAAEWKSS